MQKNWLIFDLGGVIADETEFDLDSFDHAITFCAANGVTVSRTDAWNARETCPEGTKFKRTTYALQSVGVSSELATIAASHLYNSSPSHYYKRIRIQPQMAEALRLLQKSIPLCIAGNQHPAVTEWMHTSSIASLVSRMCFDFDLKVKKPSPEFFLKAADFLSVLPSQCIYVGDRVDNDMVPATEVGMNAIRFKGDGEYARQTLASFGMEGIPEVTDTAALVAAVLAQV